MMEITRYFPLFNVLQPKQGKQANTKLFAIHHHYQLMIPTTHEIIESPAFKNLVTRRWRVSLFLTLTILFIYIGFLLLVAFNKELLAQKIGGHYTLAFPIGLGIILAAWLLTGIYVFWANNSYDQAVGALKKQYEQGNK